MHFWKKGENSHFSENLRSRKYEDSVLNTRDSHSFPKITERRAEMSNKNKSTIRTTIKPVFIILVLLVPILLVFFVFFFFFLDVSLLNENISFFESLNSHFKEILVLSVCFWALAFYYITGGFHLNEPRKTDTLATSKWKTIEEQKKEFKIAPIDPKVELSVGGAPVNKISDNEILYEIAPSHDLTMGITRSGKSRKIVRQLVMLASMANESMIFNDPKKEMYQDFHQYLSKRGYDVKCLDFRRPEVSDAWNPLDDIIEMVRQGNIDEADQYAEDQVVSLVVDNGKTEPIWVEGQKALIKALILEVTQAPIPENKKNYYSIYQTCSILGKEIKVDGSDKPLLTVYMESLEETSPARISYTPVANSKDKTTASFFSSALASLHPFTGQKLMKVLGHSSFNFHDFKDGKKALFVVNPDEKKTYDAITAMVYDNAYQSLIFEANKQSGRKLPKRVHMIFDEFGNMPKINMLETKMTVSLSREILYHLYLQDFKQMNEKYGDNVASIIRGNCALWYFISSADYDVCEEMSKKLGEETIWVQNQGGNYNERSNQTGGNVGYNQQTRRLMNANELLESDIRDGHGIIVYRSYLGPCRVDLPDCSQYKWYGEMKHDEEEIENKDLTLNYAIPRYIEISSQILNTHGIRLKQERRAVYSADGGKCASNKGKNSNDMYWYWSTRSDLSESVLTNVLEHFKNTKTPPTRERIQQYMRSESFVEWLTSIDIDEKTSGKNGKDLEQIFEKNGQTNEPLEDNAFTDAWC